MRIVIDMQGAQTESRFRGIGRYTMAFAQAVVKNCGEHEVILALSGLLPDTIEPIRAAFDGLIPQDNIRIWHALGPVREVHDGNSARRETAELMREAFLASLQPDVIHISSLFEGYVDDAVTSVGRFDTTTPISVIQFDLIPLLNPAHYLKPNPRYEQYYLRKIESLKRAALLLSISDFSGQEAIDALGVIDRRVVSISTAVSDLFQPQDIDAAVAAQLKQKIGICRPFVLYTGGSDERKNLPRLIEAYAALPANLSRSHQLLFAGKMPEGDIARFKHIARTTGLKDVDLVFTGYVTDDELVQLYNLCVLYVFPSWHEGFGLPALEAMGCGAPVIGANTTSLPEVIGMDAALFDPSDFEAIAKKMAKALQDEGFRSTLRKHGLQQAHKFSWGTTAQRAVTAWESLLASRSSQRIVVPASRRKPRLAFVSPLPPERTGIADYSAGLLPALAAHYDVELIVAQNQIDANWGKARFNVRDVGWLRANAKSIDRVLYQLGNSPFHKHMLPLLKEIPGTVVLHDFYMSGLMAWLERDDTATPAWTRSLYAAHGYNAVRERYLDAEIAKRKYPANWQVLQHAKGVIVHSEYSRKLAKKWYGNPAATDWKVIPLLRSPAVEMDRSTARKHLGIDESDFVICSFGYLDASKLNHRLLQAWLDSALAADKCCRLIFVGENHGGEYGASLLKTMHVSGLGKRLSITGFASSEVFRRYLAAADLAVQLRAESRGETSAAVLDCMNYGLPLIVNANGSMAELDAEAVLMLTDEFADATLIEALEGLWRDAARRRFLGERASAVIHDRHSPEKCAGQYAEAMEHFQWRAAASTSALIQAIADQKNFAPDESQLVGLSSALARSLPLSQPARCLFLDVTATCSNDLKTGIERVARAMMLALLEAPPEGFRVEPVYLSDKGGVWHYCYARHYTLGLLGCPVEALVDEPVQPDNGDVLLTLDLTGGLLVQAEQAGLFQSYRAQGVLVYATVFDLLPVQLPDTFPPGADKHHHQWLETISHFDGAVCISKAVADELRAWQDKTGFKWAGRRPFFIGWFHLGADVTGSAPSRGLPNNAGVTLQQLMERPSFLMVGTIEPRKGYLQVIDAFEVLWCEGVDVNLVIVGKEGWKGLPEEMRRDIPETVGRLRLHSKLDKRIFWFEGISDEYLEKVYGASTCLIAASYGEGFGLPLIEAAQHKLPIIARDIPVFREVAGDHAHYFNATTAEGLAQVISAWLTLFDGINIPATTVMPWITWKQSAIRLIEVMIGRNKPDRKITGEICKKAMDEHLDLIHLARLKLISTLLPPGEIVLDLGGANCPLYKMGYPHKFKKVYLIDLPPEDRCDMYKEIIIDPNCESGEVVIKYADMTELDVFANGSVDFVWSGQSIEHFPLDAGRRMCQAAYRVLKPGGSFCLDTPNRLITKIHTHDVGGGFIHPEHHIEYEPAQLRGLLEEAGFVIENVLGICEMPTTAKSRNFDYTDFLYGAQISEKVEQSYIQYFHCVKP